MKKIILQPYVRKANFYETDQMGIIHHSNYIRWFEEARVDFMSQIGYGYEKSIELGVDFAITGVTCDYKSMTRFGDSVVIHSNIVMMTHSRMTVEYQVRDSVTDELRVVGETRHCFLDTGKKRPVSLKKLLPDLYSLFESTMQ
ncbi:MAG: acyl-CoA thioesterase [Oscillospiraceae bacterium]|nr:acyl-CoA thioesterase [Oscillospiraceae bacterium]